MDDRPVFPQGSPEELRSRVAADLGDEPTDPATVVAELADAVGPGLVSSAGGRYFGFVTGGSVPAALSADWLAAAWDQNAFLYLSSPAASIVEDVAGRWVKELMRLPAQASVAFVTGCQMAHVTALAAARHEVLRRVGWDLPAQGLHRAPAIRVLTGERRHVTVDRALRLLGVGTEAIGAVATDDQGRIRIEALAAALDSAAGPTIVVAQAGEVNTGSFDPLAEVIEAAHHHGAWVHIDGAFGIWARLAPQLEHHVEGLELADSWALDAHKWLNVPYDSGIAVVAHPEPHRAAMLGEAAYLTPDAAERQAYDWTPDASRRARGFAVYAALRSLGRQGVTDLVERCCAHARRFAQELATIPGAEILNDVELNQVLLRFGDDETTLRVLDRVQRSGAAWMGGTVWRGQQAIRISVSSWATTDEDVDRTVAAFATAAVG
ncbi:MAG: aspartate aminotransferase family protein [Acidimicrobiales bacterium]